MKNQTILLAVALVAFVGSELAAQCGGGLLSRFKARRAAMSTNCGGFNMAATNCDQATAVNCAAPTNVFCGAAVVVAESSTNCGVAASNSCQSGAFGGCGVSTTGWRVRPVRSIVRTVGRKLTASPVRVLSNRQTAFGGCY